jgi:F-type H+-transporting ATPase subunit b
MLFDWWTLALQTINFAILAWLLHRFLYKPVLRMIDARRAEIDKQYAEVSSAEAKARDALATIEAARSNITAERDTVLKAATAQAEEVAKARRAEAEREAAALLDGARKTLATERDQALAEARKLAVDLGAGMARRVLAGVAGVLAKVRAEAWLREIEQYLAALPKPEFEALWKQFADGAPLRVVTAWALPEKAAEAWRAGLQKKFGGQTSITFDIDSHLIAGAELHFPSSILRFSWQTALEALCSEIDAHDNAR